MNRPSSFANWQTGARPGRNGQASRGVSDFLRGNEKMAALLPTVARLAAIQQDCASVLPALFDACSVLSFESGHLVLAAPNAAFAAKLKQQLPKLQDGLLKCGWQVSAIRIKVQVRKISEKTRAAKELVLPQAALHALSSLTQSLEETPRNRELKAALETMLSRHRRR
ncbi:MAG TPA: DciA family protein [Noviherbaspirillum sp.]|jgi:hypothetical protein|uniref:DciA family protein n=1 Tax=Noviherbaspirillum sp. TaxID=1926288 RepID=UPI002F9434D2